MRKLPLLLIEFDDSTHNPGWKDEKQDFGGPMKCSIVGWRVQSGKKHITLAMMRSDDGDCTERMMIPRGAITRISPLQEIQEAPAR